MRLIVVLLFLVFSVNALAVEPEVLRYWADEKEFKIGCAIDHDLWNLNPNGGFMRAVNEHNMMVAGNRMKMSALQPTNGIFNFNWTDQFVDFSELNDMQIRGHVLAYFIPYQLPQFLESAFNNNSPLRDRFLEQQNMSSEQLAQLPHDEIISQEQFDQMYVDADSLYALMRTHVSTITSRYRGRIKEWDVFNEYFDGFNRLWKDSDIGGNMLDSLFYWAHEADPDALLFYTDYNIEQWDPFSTTAKSRQAYNLVKGMVERGVPIHGVGFQSHFRVGSVNFDRLEQSVKLYDELGLRVSFCEVDFTIPLSQIENPQYYEQQASDYVRLLDIALNNDNVNTFVIWGVGDRDSWRSNQNPLLWDARYQKKPAYFAVLNHLAGVEQSISPPIVSNNDEHYRFWPNPASSFIQFNELSQIKQLEIIALNGTVVLSEVPKSARIDLASISSGLYVIRMLHYNGNITSSILKVKR